MTQWYVKGLSKLTGVSVQTLHHYDRLGLLQPSIRLPNNYRVYSEKDLSKLQQIIALKYFGFELTKIKNLLGKESDMLDHFAIQTALLDKKAETLAEASQTLKSLIASCGSNKSVPWETIIQTIEVYRMTQQLEKTWVGKILTQEELKQYAHFEKELKSRLSEKERKAMGDAWEALIKEVNANLDKNPNSAFGVQLGKRCMDWVNAYYGKNYASLRNVIWEKGLKEGQLESESNLSAKSGAWLDQAISAYYRERILTILSQVNVLPEKELIKAWEAVLEDMHGDEKSQNMDIFNAVFQENGITQDAKDWVRKYMKANGYGK